MFQKDLKISLLLDFYGDILSERRRELMEMYYNEDLSLSEIAEIAGISRQGVRDSVKKSERELEELEETLGLLERFNKVKLEIKKIGDELDTVAAYCTDDVGKKLRAIKEELDSLDI